MEETVDKEDYMTLTAMLQSFLALEDDVATVKSIMVEWLHEVKLPDYFHSDGQYFFNATIAIRQILANLVDEP